MPSTKVTTARYNDYLYDPLFVVSGEKDFYKAAVQAKIANAKFAICPIFPSMFSDLPHQPRQQYVMRQTTAIPNYQQLTATENNASCLRRNVDVLGLDRYNFFYTPVIKPEFEKVSIVNVTPSETIEVKPEVKKKRSIKIQTQYRESSAQTSPWQPADYITIDGGDPELLMLDFLKWGSGLPAGMHEVRLIERARMKRAWEKALPPITDEASMEKRCKLVQAMETDEWVFREQEIQDIQDLRLELLQQMMNELHEKSKKRTQQKMTMFYEMKIAEKEAKLKTLRQKTERELRKLDMKHHGVNKKYHKVNIVKEHSEKKSELYGPLMRHGEHPKRWHYVIDEHIKKYRAQFLGVEEISTLPRWLDEATKMKDSEQRKLPGTRLCIRETKWTTPVLKQLHEELKNLRKKEKPLCTLLETINKEPSELLTPQVECGDDWEEDLHQATILIESVLRGRASQMLIFEGRNRCRELIRELRSTHALQEEDRIQKFHQRIEVKSQQREQALCFKNVTKLQEALNKLSGTVVGTLLDFLNKELRRLIEERRVHAMCLLFERENHMREAAEAGRRQKELRRKIEHDEIFKQVVKVHQDTVDLYLQDIVTEGMDFSSHEEAQLYVDGLAEKIDNKAYSITDESAFQEKQELIASLVHNFLLPEVEKQRVRDKIKQKQHNYLKIAHEAIYNKMENLPSISPKTEKQTIFRDTPYHDPDDYIRGLQRSVHISGFHDIDLPETHASLEEPDPNNMQLVYSSPSSRADPVSLTSSLMEFEDAAVVETRLPRVQVDVLSFSESSEQGRQSVDGVDEGVKTIVENVEETLSAEFETEM